MNSPALDIANYLAVNGIGTLGTNLFVENTPHLPNDLVTVWNSGGSDPIVGVDLYRPEVMILIHGGPKKYEETYAKVQSIVTLLHGVGNMEIDDSSGGVPCRYLYILQSGDILRRPKDENNRFVFSVKFRMMRAPI